MWQKASQHASRAGLLLGTEFPLRERLLGALAAARIQLVWTRDDHCFAGLRWRARLELRKGLLTLFEGGVRELQQRLGDRVLATDLVLAHEVFHLLCPDCPPALHELAAHRFAQQQTGLTVFPGWLDQEGA